MQLLESVLLLLLLAPFQLGPVHVQRDDAPQDVPGLKGRRLQPELWPPWSAQLVVRIEVGIAAAVTSRGTTTVVVLGQVVGGTPPGLILNGRLVVGLVDPAEAPRVRVRCEKRQ